MWLTSSMKPRIITAVAVSLAVIVASWLLGSAWEKTHPAMEKINVTGLAQVDFVSDLIVWEAGYERKAYQISDAYALMKSDAALVRKYLTDHGITDAEVVFDAVNIQKSYRSQYINNRYVEEFDGYRLVQGFTVESKDVEKVERVSREISELLNAGLELNSRSPRYYYTKLSELKIDLLSRASKDGKVRAEALAENAGGRLGDLRRADMGIFQITAQNSDEEYTWGGAFNTTSRNKTASITVKMEFAVR